MNNSVMKRDLATAEVNPSNYARAILNILDDFSDEKTRLDHVQKAMLNILDDSAAERLMLEATHRATLNILDDFDVERHKVEDANQEMAREITERKRAEKELLRAKAAADHANRELEAFSYSVAHDLRAPLRSIDGFSNVLLADYSDKPLDQQGRHYLERVRAGTQRMGALIDDLLSLARLTRTPLTRERIDLTFLAQKIIGELAGRDSARNVDVQVADDLVILADRSLLVVMLENLLGNAWKFTSKQSLARIEVGQEEYGKGDEKVFFVRDNGAGFEMEYAKRLFAPFQRLHAEADFPGIGIGLATVHRIVARHAGRVWAEAKVGRGATFFFTLGEQS